MHLIPKPCLWSASTSARPQSLCSILRAGMQKSQSTLPCPMSLFMVTERVDPSEILGMTTKVSKADVAADEATAESKRLAEANTVQKRKLDALSENIETFKKKVHHQFTDPKERWKWEQGSSHE